MKMPLKVRLVSSTATNAPEQVTLRAAGETTGRRETGAAAKTPENILSSIRSVVAAIVAP